MVSDSRDTEPNMMAVPALPPNGAVELESAFLNDAGIIQNLVTGPNMRCVSIVESVAGAVRSRHYHLTDAHWLYVLRGRMLYFERDPEGEYGPPLEVKEGEMVFTGPLVVHRTEFPEATTLISMSLRPRDTESHEADLVRVGK